MPVSGPADAAGSIDDVISGITLPERSATLCLRGDLQARWEDLERQLQAAGRAEGESLAGRSAQARELAERMDAIAEEMRGHQVVFRFRGLSALAYRDLLDKHRLPEERREESADGINWKTFPAALIAACCVSHPMTAEKAEKLCDAVTDAQWDELFEAARTTNRGLINVPPTLSSSAVRAATGPSSRQPGPGESPAGSSSASSLAG
jgi:hypothetical protein